MLNREEVISEALLELIRQEEALAEADRSLELAQGRYKLLLNVTPQCAMRS